MPIVFFAFVRGTDERPLAEHVGDDEHTHFAERVRLHGIRNDKPIVAVNEPQLGKG